MKKVQKMLKNQLDLPIHEGTNYAKKAVEGLVELDLYLKMQPDVKITLHSQNK